MVGHERGWRNDESGRRAAARAIRFLKGLRSEIVEVPDVRGSRTKGQAGRRGRTVRCRESVDRVQVHVVGAGRIDIGDVVTEVSLNDAAAGVVELDLVDGGGYERAAAQCRRRDAIAAAAWMSTVIE